MNRCLPKILLTVVSVCTASLFADPITLNVIYRDFEANHPDFESYIDGLHTGLVQTELGNDGKPVNATNEIAVYDWYHETDWSTPYTGTLTLDDMGDGSYQFTDNSFFPLDLEDHILNDQHNYLFTMETHSTFTYQGGEVFDFAGDDDVWVFINGKLAIDLGGVHGVEYGSVDLDAMASSLGIVEGNDYTFDFFFAERHTVASNCMITTSIQLEPSSVPEPASVSILGISLLSICGLSVFRRRR